MQRRSRWAVVLVSLACGVSAVACGEDDPERLARAQDSADLEMEARSAGERGVVSTGVDSQGGAVADRVENGGSAGQVDGPGEVRMVVPVGTTFAIRLNETLEVEKSRVGDPFTATLGDPLVDLRGQVLLPSGSLVRGRVTGIDQPNSHGTTPIMVLAFEAVSFDGQSYPLQATVVEANPERKAGFPAEQVADSAAKGEDGVEVLGKNVSPIDGDEEEQQVMVAGGTAIAMGTADRDAVLPAGSRMVIRLDRAVEVGR